MSKTIHAKIKDRIGELPEGSVFVLSDFSDLADPKTVSKTLTRLCQGGGVAKVMRGVFWKPFAFSSEDDDRILRDLSDEYSSDVEVEFVGAGADLPSGAGGAPATPVKTGPDPDSVARALARNNLWQIVPSGDTARHLIGIAPDAPAVWTYITDGAYRTYSYGDTVISFQHASSKFMSQMSEKTAVVIQVIKTYGKDRIPDWLGEKLRQVFRVSDWPVIISESRHTTAWIAAAVRKLSADDRAGRVTEQTPRFQS